eukprot:6154421-Alexandrium_andersonii.AAC.1
MAPAENGARATAAASPRSAGYCLNALTPALVAQSPLPGKNGSEPTVRGSERGAAAAGGTARRRSSRIAPRAS